MESLDPKNLDNRQMSRLILGAVTPRPIALVSSLSKEGVPNLAPFSFFNVFSTNPPVLGFSPANRGKDGTFKDTYINIKETRECVVQLVTHSMGEQVSLASGEFASDVNEFVKSGLTPIASELVKPPRVKESPYHMECRLRKIINLGDGPASGNLILCDIARIHINESLNWREGIDPLALDTIGRLGGPDYIRMHRKALYKIPRPQNQSAMGFENLPQDILNSEILTGNNLAALAGCEDKPTQNEQQEFADKYNQAEPQNLLEYYLERSDYENALGALLSGQSQSPDQWHKVAKTALDQSDVSFAWNVLMLQLSK